MAIMNNYLVQNSLLKFHLQAVLQIPTTKGMVGSENTALMVTKSEITRGFATRDSGFRHHSGNIFHYCGWYSYTTIYHA